ncbi:EamA family transporter [Streptomyces varsoviensis]|uniref:EamA family transporter n=1 Tax=Streptomyces varsoviensis TaxID=67373 RepID=UPI0033F08203
MPEHRHARRGGSTRYGRNSGYDGYGRYSSDSGYGRNARSSRYAARLPLVLVLAQICSLQMGAAVAKGAYDQVGATALAGMRLFFAAVIMWVAGRPRLRRVDGPRWRAAVALGLALAAMNVAYFQAIRFLPIGVASTVELLGPLALAVALSRRVRDLAAALLALCGVLLLMAPGQALPVAGLLLGAAAAVCRAGYVVLSRQVGQRFPDASGLALALAVGACALTPVAAATAWRQVAAHPSVLGIGLLVAVLSSLVPYSLDMTVLRRVGVRAFGLLLSLSPAVGAGVGALLLHESLTGRQIAAIALVVAATAWSVAGPNDDASSTRGHTGRRPSPRRARNSPADGPRENTRAGGD